MYLRNAPVTFVKDGERRIVYHNVTADELLGEGWLPEVCESIPSSQEKQEVPQSMEDSSDSDETLEDKKDLNEMTKSQLIDWAVANNVNITPYATKAEILAICLEAQSE